MALHPPSTANAEQHERGDAAEQIRGHLNDVGPHDRASAAEIRIHDAACAQREDRDGLRANVPAARGQFMSASGIDVANNAD